MKKLFALSLLLALVAGGAYGGWALMRHLLPPAPAPVAAPGNGAGRGASPANRQSRAEIARTSPAAAADHARGAGGGKDDLAAMAAPAMPGGAAPERSGVDLAGRGNPTGAAAAARELPPLTPAPAAPATMRPAPRAAQRASAGGLENVYREADAMLARKDGKGAAAVLRRHLRPGAAPENAATLYRLGLAERYAGNEDAAQAAWGRAHQECPLLPGGRMSAIALGDTFYAWYAGKEPKYEQWEKIRDLYSDALGMDGARFLDPRVEAAVAARLNQLNDRLVFSPYMPVRGAQLHTVKSGENLTTIARRYNLDTWRSLAEVNHVNPSTLRVGDRLKVVTGRVFILVNKRTFTLSWYLDGVFIRRYRCATGAVGSETPPGRYKIVRMDVNPEWRDPNTGKIYKYGEPGHAIGSRWMAMEGEGTHGLGIHGTIDPDSMGKKASNGCIRLLKKDVEELYGFVSIQRGNESEVLVLE